MIHGQLRIPSEETRQQGAQKSISHEIIDAGCVKHQKLCEFRLIGRQDVFFEANEDEKTNFSDISICRFHFIDEIE